MREQLMQIKEKRNRLHKALEENRTSIDVIIEAMYYDSETHFIWELLQNGDDAGATKLRLEADDSKERVILEHNGRPFTISDIDGISNIGASTKKHNLKKTGKFGVGFKSVFSFCDSVEIYNGDISIELTNRLNFEILENNKEVPLEKTIFVFKGVKGANDLINKVFIQLDDRQDAFMYLNTIEEITICNKTFKAKEVLASFYSTQTEHLTFSFKEGIKGNFYCLFPLKCETKLPIHINASFDVTASRDDFRGNSDYNDMLFREYENNFVRILHEAKKSVTVGTMMEIILKSDQKFQLKTEKLLKINEDYYAWNELIQDNSSEKIFERFPFLLKGTKAKKCADIEGLIKLREENIPYLLSHLQLNLNDDYRINYIDFIKFILESKFKREYLFHKIFVSEDGEIRHGDYCEFFKFKESIRLHLKNKKSLHSMFSIPDIYNRLDELEVGNDHKINIAYTKICETKELCGQDIAELNLREKEVLKNILKKVPLFNELCADEVWVVNNLLYILNPNKNFVPKSMLTDFLEITSSIDSLCNSKDELSEEKVKEILTCGDSHRMLLMLSFIKDNLGVLPFFRSQLNNLLDTSKVEVFFDTLFRTGNIVFDIYGNNLKAGDTTYRTIEPAFLEAYKNIYQAPDISKYLGQQIDNNNSIWGYGDGELETENTRGLDPRMIGEAGEIFAYKMLLEKYPDKKVIHLNGMSETGKHYDILIDGKIKVEVKTRKSHFSHAKREVKLSDLQVRECIFTQDDNFWLAIVNLDMQKIIIIKKSEMLYTALKGLSVGPHIFN